VENRIEIFNNVVNSSTHVFALLNQQQPIRNAPCVKRDL
jgi:hypothetical protein